MKTIPLLIALLIAFLSFSSCKKTPLIPENQAKFIVGKQWKLTAYTEDDVDKLTENYDPCELDNFAVYSADGNYIVDEGPTKCNDYDLQVQEGFKWEIKDKKLFLTYEDLNMGVYIDLEFEILEISARTLKYALRNPDESGVYVYTFTAQ